MNFLPRLAFAEIEDFDWLHHRKFGRANVTRFYKYLLPAGGDMEIHTVAVKTRKKDGTVFVKEVIRASVDEHFFFVKDVAFRQMAGYIADWSPEKMGPEPASWGYGGRWASEAYSGSSGMWKLARPVVNPEALLKHDRFKWCAWQPACGDILDYLKAYAKQPRVELLSKAGAGRFATRVGFVSQLERDKGLTRFFMEHLAEIQKYRYGCDVIRMAYRRGTDLADAQARIAHRREFRGCHLPAIIDAYRAICYTAHAKISRWDYCNYLRDCQKLGLDLTDTKVAFPKQFKNRRTIVADRVAELDRQKQAELAKKQDAQIAAVAARFARLERARGVFRVQLPRRTADFIREGKRLHNCLGDGHYAAKMSRGETLIVFVRRSDSPARAFVAAEYAMDQKRVLQCYAAKNAKPPEPVLNFVNRLLSTPKGSKS